MIEADIDMGNYKGHENCAKEKLCEYITITIYVCIAAFVVFIAYICFSNEVVLFTWHPILLATGWIMLMAEGILLLSPRNSLVKGLSHKLKVKYHWIIQTIGVGFTLIGFLVIYIHKNLHNKSHFYTWHGFTGLISVIFCIPACIAGIFALYAFTFRNYMKPTSTKLIHRIVGILTFAVGVLTVLIGLYTNWFQRHVQESIKILWFCIILGTAVWTISCPFVNVVKRIRNSL